MSTIPNKCADCQVIYCWFLIILFSNRTENTKIKRYSSTLFCYLIMELALSLMYDTGARVQEIADLTVADVRLEDPPTVKMTGKGNKSRLVPLMTPTAKLMPAE